MTRVSGEAYRLAMHSMFHQKKNIILALVALLPAIAAALGMLGDAVDEEWGVEFSPALGGLTNGIVLAVSIPLTCLLLAGGMIADEAQERTLSYLLTRPVPRRTLYLSRMLAVWTFAVPLGIFQVVSMWVVRFVAFTMYGTPGQVVEVSITKSILVSLVFWKMLPVLIAVAILATLFYSSLFGLVSLASLRYHFFITIAYIGIWEGLLGHIPTGAQRLTATHYLLSILDRNDPTSTQIFRLLPTGAWWSALVLLVAVALASWISLIVVRRRDFHVTSAAT